MLDRGEVDVRPLDTIARVAGKTVAYPFLDAGGAMSLRCATPDSLEMCAYGFAAPPADAPDVDVDSGLLIVVPALAVDLAGYRLGYGKGFYDRMLSRMAPPATSIAVAYDFQVLADLPTTTGDQPVDMVLTDVRTWTPGRAR